MHKQSSTAIQSAVQPFIDGMKEQMRRNARMTEAEIDAAISSCSVRWYPKGTVLLREGQVATMSYFVFKGCVREYYLKDGEEVVSEFYTEGDSFSSDISKINRTPARHYWECTEDVILSLFSYENEKEMFRRFPRLESLCRINGETELGKLREKMAFFAASTAEERYLNLLENRPDLLDRVPQYQLASYLGIKPESLSRIRARLRLQEV
ncbi:MAG: Crp/Fnr family transcriptional regulator [Saprospiraceae bacterium]|nr:Crp/Fnr family transcriptional regulator [Saprospiraceae bacterium]